ncbi:stressosome-associated protein Prli42 [Cohnella yongneupensis]|uniref:Stressosome-associated protein Prli42 n=1 Tax=Cohnella yongneupensis TaxID=425006 RepID=A0ABW0R351_9BACL
MNNNRWMKIVVYAVLITMLLSTLVMSVGFLLQ